MFRILAALAFVVLLTLRGQAQQLLESYTAFISTNDLYNSNGQRLRQPWQIIRQDRANYHRFGTGDPQDQWDSFFGDFKYSADISHLDYVNPDAPKGGEISQWAQGTFDSFNLYTRKGRQGALSTIGHETILTNFADEPTAAYCLLCTTMEYPESKDWVIFNLRPEVRFADGTPRAAE